MPTLENHPSSKRVKALIIGDSSAGKTGGLASLANAGRELFIIDLDVGLDILRSFVKSEFQKNVHFATITDEYKGSAAGVGTKTAPTVYAKTLRLLDHWKYEGEDFGPVKDWGPERTLVMDSFTSLGGAAYRYIRSINGRVMGKTNLYDYGPAQEMQEGVLNLLMSESIRCNVIVLAHVVYQEGEGDLPTRLEENAEGNEVLVKDEKGYPAAIGRKLSPRVGQYFNTLVLVKTKVVGDQVRRTIRTSSSGMIDLKTPVPQLLPLELPLSTGYETIFQAIQTLESQK